MNQGSKPEEKSFVGFVRVKEHSEHAYVGDDSEGRAVCRCGKVFESLGLLSHHKMDKERYSHLRLMDEFLNSREDAIDW